MQDLDINQRESPNVVCLPNLSEPFRTKELAQSVNPGFRTFSFRHNTEHDRRRSNLQPCDPFPGPLAALSLCGSDYRGGPYAGPARRPGRPRPRHDHHCQAAHALGIPDDQIRLRMHRFVQQGRTRRRRGSGPSCPELTTRIRPKAVDENASTLLRRELSVRRGVRQIRLPDGGEAAQVDRERLLGGRTWFETVAQLAQGLLEERALGLR